MSVDPDWEAEFDRVWPMLDSAIQSFGDTHSREGIHARLLAHKAQLWTGGEAAILTSIEQYDTGLTECHLWLAAGEMEAVLKIRPVVEEWAKSLGCDRMMIVGRKGWTRVLPDYQPLAVILTKELV